MEAQSRPQQQRGQRPSSRNTRSLRGSAARRLARSSEAEFRTLVSVFAVDDQDLGFATILHL